MRLQVKYVGWTMLGAVLLVGCSSSSAGGSGGGTCALTDWAGTWTQTDVPSATNPGTCGKLPPLSAGMITITPSGGGLDVRSPNGMSCHATVSGCSMMASCPLTGLQETFSYTLSGDVYKGSISVITPSCTATYDATGTRQ